MGLGPGLERWYDAYMTNNTDPKVTAELVRAARGLKTQRWDPTKGRTRRTTHTRKNIR